MSTKRALLFLFILLSIFLNIFLLSKLHFNLTAEVISNGYFHYIQPFQTQPSEDSEAYILHYEGLKEKLQQDIDSYDAVKKVGIFLQDSATGTWLGIDEKEEFAPASLLKVPIMMATLKQIDSEETELNDEIIISKEYIDESSANFSRIAGEKESILRLLKDMIIFSDNTAKKVLESQLSAAEINAIFSHVGVENPYLKPTSPKISPRDYIRFFKSLYYSTFLSPKLSELALDMASDTNEESLISKEIPKEIEVSHKFGVYDEFKVLNDCGIIYYPKDPYFLCIMTKDLSYETSRELIQKLSKDVFEYVNERENLINS
jgi:beta-lactamase class A